VFRVAAGGDASISVGPAACTVTVIGPVPVFTGLLESTAFTVIVEGPAVVGVPLITQPAPSVSPAGSVPAVIVQVYGGAPPETGIGPVYGVPTVAVGGELMMMFAGAGTIVTVTGPLAVSMGLPASVAFTTRFDVPATVGVPLTTQPAPSVRPAGSAPDVIEQLYGDVPPATPMVAE
jgi:hypothetical protein